MESDSLQSVRLSGRAIGLISLGLIALALRVAVVIYLSGQTVWTYEHGEIASNLVAGRGFTVEFLGARGPTSQQAPLYPMMLAGLFWLCGPESTTAVFLMQLLQCLVGTAIVLCVVWLAWSLVPQHPAVGYVAGLGAAVHPAHLYATTHIQIVLWATLLLTLLLAVVSSPRFRASPHGAAGLGILAGLLLLVEPILVVALPIIAVLVWRRCRTNQLHSRRTWRRWLIEGPLARVGLMAAVAALIIAPWLWRNWRVHGEFVFIKSTFGYALWQGNNDMSWGTDKIPKPSVAALRKSHDGTIESVNQALWEARHETLYIDDVLLKPHGYIEFSGLSEPARARLLGKRATAFILANPGRYARLCLKRLQYFLLFDETNPKAANRIYRGVTVIWLVLAGVGLLAARSHWRTLWPGVAIFAVVALFHTAVIVSPRFRIPVEPITFIWAAWAVTPPAGRILHALAEAIHKPRTSGKPAGIPAHQGHVLGGPHRLPKRPVERRARRAAKVKA